MMKKIFTYCVTCLLIFLPGAKIFSQKHLANGESVIDGNRLISVKSDVGKQLYDPESHFFSRNIAVDAEMSEPEWEQAQIVTPFVNAEGKLDRTAVRVLYDQSNIYLFWTIDQPSGVISQMKEKDSIITSGDFVQIDLKPWLPDSICYGRGYSYSIAVNPAGIIWDSYFDPYLGGFFYSSWNSGAKTVAKENAHSWQVEMEIPYAGLDVASDPGWKWNLEFHHGTYAKGKIAISSANVGITVEQDIMVRQPGLVSYYWARPDFMPEVKRYNNQAKKQTTVTKLAAIPKLNDREDAKAWEDAKVLSITQMDRMGERVNENTAKASIGIFENTLCFNLKADGATIRTDKDTSGNRGSGMAAQMAGVNGVFVDQSLFQNESFWIILQPRNINADQIHEDYYMLIVNNRGEISGTHYDSYGTPYKFWEPKADVDIYNTKGGWGAEVNLDLASLDISPGYSNVWGIDIFRNRLIPGKGYELQAWQSTGNDFLNPGKLGELSGVKFSDLSLLRSCLQRKKIQTASQLAGFKHENPQFTQKLEVQLKSLPLKSMGELRTGESRLTQMDYVLGKMEASLYYRSSPHPSRHGFPLMDVQFIGDHGWAVGAMGTILRSEDGGHHWINVVLKSEADLYRVRFVNEKDGWAVGGRIRMGLTNDSMRHDQRGGYGYIYHTKDGGKTWDCQFAERGRLLFALDFVNRNVGYTSGERGFLMKTTDGGRHWNILPTTGTRNWLYGMAFKDELTGFAVGLNETVIKTIDGGNSWQKLKAPADKKFYGFSPIYRDICFNGNTGCIVGENGSVLMSHDGGANWEPSANFFEKDVRELMDLRSVQFVTPLLGFAVGELGTKIMITEDGGKNWSLRTTGNAEWLRAIWADRAGKLVVVGEREKIIASRDFGFNWRQLHGEPTKVDVLILMSHGDDAAVNLNSFLAYYAINQGKKIVNVGVVSNLHSSEYEETYNFEMDRNSWMIGVGTCTNFIQFETGNNGANYYHYNQRLWQGEDNITRHMVAVIRAYRPDIVITHDGVFGDYDKPGHKVSGRAGLQAFNTSGAGPDAWPELTRLGLKPWQPKKLYNLAGDKHLPQSYPATIDLSWIANQPLKGTHMNCREFGNYVIRNFQSQGVYHHTGETKLSLIKSRVITREKENSIFDGLSSQN